MPVNLLCVVTGAAARRGQAVYQGLKKLGGRYLQFIPCLDPLEEERGGRPFSLTPERYGQFLCTVFDLWYQDWTKGDYVSIRLFDDYVHLLAGQPAGTCATAGPAAAISSWRVTEASTPVTFLYWIRGGWANWENRRWPNWPSLHPRFNFAVKAEKPRAACAGCEWLPLCNGGCRRDWIGMDRNYHCAALRTFFAHAYPRLRQMAALERRMY